VDFSSSSLNFGLVAVVSELCVALFSLENFLVFGTVALSFLFIEPVPSPGVARLFDQAMSVTERRGVVHLATMLLHFVHELAFMTAAIQQVPHAP
jgi:hypothetical protein